MNTLDYQRPVRRMARSSLPWQTIVAILLLFLAQFDVCACGHFDRIALPFTTCAAAFAGWGFVVGTRSAVYRVAVITFVVLSSFVWVKNVVDVLWLGHEPML